MPGLSFHPKTGYYVVSPLRTKVLNAGNSGRLDRYGYLSRGPAAHKTEIEGVPVAGLDEGKLNRVHNETKA